MRKIFLIKNINWLWQKNLIQWNSCLQNEYIKDNRAFKGVWLAKGDLHSKGPMLVKKSRQRNLYRSPNLHSSVSGSNCQSVFPSAVVRLLQSRASRHQVRTTWQLRSRVQHGSTTQSRPRGQWLHFMERQSFLKAVSHEGVCLLMQIYLHYIGRWWYTNCQLILIKHHIFPLRVRSHTSCSAEEGTGGWRGETAGERLSRGGHSSKTHPSFQRWPNITLLTVTMTHTLKEFQQSFCPFV